jgi:hypothetical protein
MADLRIIDAPSLPTEEITDELKLPTGGKGNYAVEVGGISEHIVASKDLADKNFVNNSSNGVRQLIEDHLEDVDNPHSVTKEQVGLGNVDNTADLDKPVSNATQAAIITATNDKATVAQVNAKADKTYVDNQLNTKANNSRVDSIETNLEDSKALVQYDGKYEFNSAYAVEIGGYPLNARVVLSNGDIVQNTIAGNMVNPNFDMTGWVNHKEIQEFHNKSFVTITDLTNDSSIDAALMEMGDRNIVNVKIPKGDWTVSSPVLITNDIEFNFDVGATITIKSGGSLKFSGSATKISSYIIDVSVDSYVLSGIDTSSLNSGDLICLYDTTDFSFCNARAYYRKGEFLEVRKVINSTDVQLSSRPLFNYTSFDLYKINPIKVKFNRFNIKNEAGVSIPVVIDFGRDITVDEYSNDTAINSAFTIKRSFNVTVNPIKTQNLSPASGSNYGLTISNCQQFNINGGFYQGTRHGIALGGSDDICAIPTQQGVISNAIVKYEGETNVMAADMHGNVNFIKYVSCTLDGAKMGGSNCKLVSCEISGRSSDNLTILASEIRGGYLDIIDCKLLVNGAPSSDFGYIYFVLNHKLKDNLNINIKNLEIISSDAQLDASANVVHIRSSVQQDFTTVSI